MKRQTFGKIAQTACLTVMLAAVPLTLWAASSPGGEKIPNFTPSAVSSWQVNFWDFILPPPPGAGHGPIMTDPAYPYTSQIQNGGQVRVRPGTYQVVIANAKDPILKPWAAKEMQERNDTLLADKRAFENASRLEFRAQSRCWPGGTTGQLLFLEPLYFLQTPTKVTLFWQRNGLVRHVYLTDKHSENVKPSWSGESIGHYENGDTLVIDTIGIKGGKYHYLDSFGTPHTDKLHVVERYTIAPDAKTLTALVTVEDPDTFNAPLTLTQTWRRTNLSYQESVCAEDEGEDHFGQNLEPIPTSDKREF